VALSSRCELLFWAHSELQESESMAVQHVIAFLHGRVWLLRVLRRRFVVSRTLGLRVRIPPGAWMFVSCVVSKDKRQNAGRRRQWHKYGWSTEYKRKKITPGHGCMFLVHVVCWCRNRRLRRADHSFRGGLPSVCVSTVTLYTNSG
jgi:hypothetical protein